MKILPLIVFLAVSAHASAEIVGVIEQGSQWNYWDGSAAPSGSWTALSYTPTGWKSGNSSFGYSTSSPADPADATTISYGPNSAAKYMTSYYRKVFTVPTAPVGQPYNYVIIGMSQDDGAVVYVNGVELFRENMPTTGTITYSTAATSGLDGAAETAIKERILPISILNLSGNNSVAVEVHQNAASSSDMHFNFFLNVSNAAICYGEAFPGVGADMEDTVEDTDPDENDPTRVHKGYLRVLDIGETGLQLDAACTKIVTGYSGGGEIFSTTSSRPNLLPLPSRVIRVDMNTHMEMLTEPIDTRNYSNVKASLDVLCWKDPLLAWAAADYLKGSIFYSVDGINFTETPWFEYKGTGNTPQVFDTLVAETAPNKWRVPTAAADDANDAGGKNWKQLGYTLPGTWKDGAGGMGYETDAAGTYNPYFASNTAATIAAMKSEMYNLRPSIYLRIPFSMSVPNSTYNKLELHVRWEDGFIAYLNGTKVASGNDPASPTFASAATADRPDSSAVQYQVIDITAFKGLLVQGSNANVLAIQGLNSSAGSSDMLTQAKLLAYKPGPVDPTTLSALGTSETGPFVNLNTGTKIPAGTRSVKIKITADLTGDPANGINKAYFLDNLKFSGQAISPNNFGSFMSVQLPNATDAQRLPDADGDGDGIPNLVEYAFGSDAGTASQVDGAGAPLPPAVSYMPNGTMRLTFRMRSGFSEPGFTFSNPGYRLIGDVRYQPEFTTDLDLWEYANQFEEVSVIDNDNGTQTAIVETVDPVRLLNAKFFMRLKTVLLRASWLSDENDACPL